MKNNYNKVLIIFSVVMFAVNLIMGITLRYDPLFDVGAVHKGAIEWVEKGSFEGYYEYFAFFPNNIGSMTFLYVIFKIVSIVGVTDYFATAVVVSSAMLCTTMVLVSLLCKTLLDVRHAVFVLVLFALGVQFWFMGAAVYTDVLSMLFPVLLYYMYLSSKKKQGKEQWLMYIAMGIIASIGCAIKFTVFIMVIAIIIDMCINKEFKRLLKMAGCVIGIMAVSSLVFNSYMYSFHIDKELAEKNNTPYSHWVMMGLKGEGLYNPGDYEFTRGFGENREEKVNEEIIRRVKEKGFSGMYDLFTAKSVRDFGDGTYGIGDCLSCTSLNDTFLRDWVTYNGRHYAKFSHYATAIHITAMIFMLCMAWFLLQSNRKIASKMMPVYLSIFGVFCFLLMWETNRRYFSNFMPLIFMCGALGVDKFISACNMIFNRISIGLKSQSRP